MSKSSMEKKWSKVFVVEIRGRYASKTVACLIRLVGFMTIVDWNNFSIHRGLYWFGEMNENIPR
jgi:hypothetical protein